MTNEVATTDGKPKMSQMALFRRDLDNMQGEIASVLPRHVTFDRFKRVVLTAMQQGKDLMLCQPKTIFAACLSCAKDGLIPDGREAALVKFGDDCQYMPMVNGLIKLARQSGEISTLTAQIVYEKDEFEIDLASDTRPVHRPCLDGERGKFRIAYALATFKDGTHQLEVMTHKQIETIRSISRQKDKGPWKNHWDEMARKTVLRRLMKYLSLSPELARAIDADDATYDLAITREQERAALPASINDDVPMVTHGRESTQSAADSHGDMIDPDTGEVTEGQPDENKQDDEPYGVADLAKHIGDAQSGDVIMGLFIGALEEPVFQAMTPASILDVAKQIVSSRFFELQLEYPDLARGQEAYIVHLSVCTSIDQLRQIKADFEKTKAFIDMDASQRAKVDAYYAVARKAVAS